MPSSSIEDGVKKYYSGCGLIVSVNRLLSGNDFDFQCHSNLVRAVLPYGLTESDVHDVINIFQVTGLNKDGKYFMFVSSSIQI